MKIDEPREMEIDISTGTIIRTILILVLFALVWFLRDIILVVLTAVILASAIEPLVRFIVHRGVPRLLSLVLVYLVGATLLGGVFYFFVPAIIDDLSRLARVAPQYFDLSSLWNPLQDGGVATSVSVAPKSGIEQQLLAG